MALMEHMLEQDQRKDTQENYSSLEKTHREIHLYPLLDSLVTSAVYSPSGEINQWILGPADTNITIGHWRHSHTILEANPPQRKSTVNITEIIVELSAAWQSYNLSDQR